MTVVYIVPVDSGQTRTGEDDRSSVLSGISSIVHCYATLCS